MYSGRATYMQSQIPYASGENYSVPMSIPGMISGDDFVSFLFSPDFPHDFYRVTVPVLIGPNFQLSIGKLASRHLLPNTQFDPYGSIALIPSDPQYPSFVAPMRRGGVYTIPAIRKLGRGQVHSMSWSA